MSSNMSGLRDRLVDFYRVFNSEKATDDAFIDGLVSKYGEGGRDGEQTLFAKLRQRYGGGGTGNTEERRTVPLFGGAFFAQIPGRFSDLSLVRQVPDHQEVWHEVLTDASGKGPGDADSEGFGAVFVVELMELEASVKAAAAAEHYFADLAKDNAAREFVIASRETFAAGPGGKSPSSAPLLPVGAPVSVVHGMQFVRRGKARGEGGESQARAEAEARGDLLDGTAEVFVSIACVRLQKYAADLVCSLSTPRRRGPKAAAAAAERATEAAEGAVRAAAALAKVAAEVAADASATAKKKTNAEAAALAAAAAADAAKEAAAMAEEDAAKEAAAAAVVATDSQGGTRAVPSAARKALPPLARRRAMCCARFYAFLRSLSLVDAGKVFAEAQTGGDGAGPGAGAGAGAGAGDATNAARRTAATVTEVGAAATAATGGGGGGGGGGGDSATEQQEPMLALPNAPANTAAAEGEDSATTVVVNGEPLRLDALGPIILNTDGSTSRISNWTQMAEVERQRALRLIAKRNKKRREKLQKEEREAREKAEKEKTRAA